MRFSVRTCFAWTLVASLAVLLLPTAAPAQLPAARLEGIFPAGANPGTTLEVTIAGTDLDDPQELTFSNPGISATRKMLEPGPFEKGPQPSPDTFTVKVGDKVPVGTYDVRVRGRYGVSNPRVFQIGLLTECVEEEPNEEAENATACTLPATVNGKLQGTADVDLFTFEASPGERILAACYGRRLDSALDAVVAVYDTDGRELAINRLGHAGEPLVDFNVPGDGKFLVKVFDSLYRGGKDYVYRLSVGALPHIDFVFPPAGLAGSHETYTIYGRNLPGGKPSDFHVGGRPLEAVTARIKLPNTAADESLPNARIDAPQAFMDCVEYRLASGNMRSNVALIGIATAPTIVEAEPNDGPLKAQKLEVPCEVAGRFYQERDADWYEFEATQGDVLMMELFSHRLGLPTDPLLLIEQITRTKEGEEQVRVVATADDSGHDQGGREFDTRSGDPVYRFEAPADATYRVQVSDGYSSLRRDPRLVYRLAIRKPQPDFRLVAVPDQSSEALLLRKGGRQAVTVVAERRDGFDGEIRVTARGLPAGVSAADAVIGPTLNATALVLTAAENAGETVGKMEVVGTADVAGKEVSRVALCGAATVDGNMRRPNQRLNSLPARLTRELIVSVSGKEVSPVSLQTEDKVWETARAGILKLPFKVTRREDYKGAIQAEVLHLPANVNRVNFSIGGGKNDGEMQINLRSNTPTGTYTLHVGAYVQSYPYKRNPEAAEAATKRKEELTKIAKETADVAKAAAAEKTKADQLGTQAAASLKSAQTALTNAETAVKDAEKELATAEQAVKNAESAVAARPEDQQATAALEAAKKTRDAAAAKLADSTKSLEAAVAKQKEADAEAAAAKKAQEAAAEKAAQTAETAKAAAAAKTAAERAATTAVNAAKPRNVNFWTAAPPVTIKITEAPVELTGLPEKLDVKQGEKTELPLGVKRLYDFNDQVTFSANLPRGVAGLQIANGAVARDKQAGTLAVTAATNATPGDHEITLRATMRFNNQNVTIERPVLVHVEKVEEAPKK